MICRQYRFAILSRGKVSPLHKGNVRRIAFSSFSKAHVLLNKIALGTAIAGSALFGAREAKATPVEWGSFSEVVGSIPEGYYQNYTSSNSSSLPNKCSGILYYVDSILGSIAIGGFDLSNLKSPVYGSYASSGSLSDAKRVRCFLETSNSIRVPWRVTSALALPSSSMTDASVMDL